MTGAGSALGKAEMLVYYEAKQTQTEGLADAAIEEQQRLAGYVKHLFHDLFHIRTAISELKE